MAKIRGLAAKRRKCVVAINEAYGRNVVTANSGHVAIAEHLVNLGYNHHSGPIGKPTAAKIICAFCETGFAKEIKTPKKIKKNKNTNSYKNKSADFLKSWEWRTLRFEVLKEYGRRCMCCGATPDDGETKICVDHIKPRYKFPELSLERSNLQVLCDVCNQGKGAWDETDFRNAETEYIDDEERRFQIELASEAKTYQ